MRCERNDNRRWQMVNMASRTIIPRFLLPLQSPLWRSSARVPKTSPFRGVRYNSDKPIVLEKPLKFNPPSHGSRLRNKTLPKHYGAVITPEELSAQKQRSYPGLMAPEGTWSHWFWHSKMLHTCITLVSSGELLSHGLVLTFGNRARSSSSVSQHSSSTTPPTPLTKTSSPPSPTSGSGPSTS